MKNVLGLIFIGLAMSFDIACAGNETDQTQNSEGNTSGYYSGASIGTSSIDINCGHYGRYYYDCNDSELAFRLFGGKSDVVSLGPVDLGIEIGYANLGQYMYEEVDAIDATVALRVNLPLGTAIIGRAGYAAWDASNDGTDDTWAVGIEKGWTHAFARIEFQRFDIEDTDFDVYMLSGGYKF